MKKIFDKNKLYIIFMTVFWGFIFFNVPIGHDDWVWGSHMGTDYFNNMFGDLNGRYLGSLFSIILTRGTLVRVLLMTGITSLIVIFMSKVIVDNNENGKINRVLVIGSILLYFTPKEIFKQTFSWISGFANYVPPILLMLIYIKSIKNLFADEYIEEKSITKCFFYFILAACSQLFMEHMTLYMIVLSCTVLCYSYIRFKKISLKDIAYFLGITSGTIIMFTNPTYFNIANDADVYQYRTMPKGGILTTIRNAIVQYCNLINKEYLMQMIVVVVLLSVLAIICLSRVENKKIWNITKLSMIIVVMYPAYLIYSTYNTYLFLDERFIKYLLQGIFTVAYYFSLIIIMVQSIDNMKVLKFSIFLLISAWVLIAPLTVVTPIGGRNLLASYVFLIILVMQLVSYLNISKDNLVVNYGIIGSHIVIVLALGFIFRSIGVDERFRVKMINEQRDNNESIIYVPSIRHDEYLQIGNPDFDGGYGPIESFKAYYKIDKDVQIKRYTNGY